MVSHQEQCRSEGSGMTFKELEEKKLSAKNLTFCNKGEIKTFSDK